MVSKVYFKVGNYSLFPVKVRRGMPMFVRLCQDV